MYIIELITSPEDGSSCIFIKWKSTIKHFNIVLDRIPNAPIMISCNHVCSEKDKCYSIIIETTNDPRFIEMFQATHALISNNDL